MEAFYKLLDPTFKNPFVADNGILYQSPAHYYYIQKVRNETLRMSLFLITDIFTIESTANKRDMVIRDNWPTLRKDIMRKALLLMCIQNEKCKEILLSTGNKHIDMNIQDNFSSELVNGEYRNRNDFMYTEDNLVGELYMFIRELFKKNLV